MKPFFSVTIDVEDWYHHPSVSGYTFSKYKNTDEFFKHWKGRYDYISKPTQRILNLLSEYNIKGTFFIVGEIARRYNGLVEKIANSGHEIACHGYDHSSPIDTVSKDRVVAISEYRNRIKEAKESLEEIAPISITGFRAPGAYLGGWSIDILEELGFEYDSSVSVNSLYNKTDCDLEGVGRRPYFPKRGSLKKGEPRAIIEIPWPYLKIGSIKIPTAGAFFLRILGSRIIYEGLKQSLKTGSSILYFHPQDISDEKTPDVFSANRPFYWLFKGRTTENRIRWILSNLDVEFVTMKEYARRWRKILLPKR